jgi:hypothetical protein
MAKAQTANVVELKPINLRTVEIPLEGITELIVHNWSEKAKKMMLDKQMGKAVEKRPKKDPEEDYKTSFYYTKAKACGFPAVGFKAAIVGACRSVDGLPMTKVKQIIRVEGTEDNDMVEIEGKPRMREDMVRLETGVADIRYRAGFPKWKATIKVTFLENVLSFEQVVNLVNLAGLGGIGEWRPSSPKSASGSYGCFRVISEKAGK